MRRKPKSVVPDIGLAAGELPDEESGQTETVDQNGSEALPETVTESGNETKPQPASYSFDYYILDECNQIATVKTVLSSKSSEAEAIADASAQLGDLNWRYTGNFKRQ